MSTPTPIDLPVTIAVPMPAKADTDPEDPEVVALAGEVMGYLRSHPDAADTMEHIARWWILQQRIEAGLAATQRALDYLERQGALEKTVQGVYRLAKQRKR